MVIRKEQLLKDLNERKNPNSQKLSDHPLLIKPREPEQDFPVLSEVEVVRHYSRLARMNYSWDDGLYPLGSCTMKYNSLLNEKIAGMAEIANLHPSLPAEKVQGALEIVYETESMISRLLDIHGVTLQPAAGAHGELIGVYMISAYFAEKGEQRKKILIPDSAHGTNPASASMGGFDVQKIGSGADGLTDLADLRKHADKKTAALMLTNPNTLGVFETQIVEIKKILDEQGILLYMDGANLNAMVGKISFGAMGVDLTQLNLHKTFSTPHGGGGPGQGALGYSERMKPYLPEFQIRKNDKGVYEYYRPEKSIGRMKTWYGQFGNILRAWAYILSYGNQSGKIAETAVLNANYLRKKIEGLLEIASPNPSMHEAVFNHNALQQRGLSTLNLAKALLDCGFYAPTIYFPLSVPGAIMIEPTETETKAEMDLLASAIKEIFEQDADVTRHSPHYTSVQSIDETGAARNPVLTWRE